MSLSKRRYLILVVCAWAGLLPACSWFGKNANTASSSPANQAKSEPPFSTREPDTYQGNFYAGTSEYQNHWFVSKKGDNWRVDFFKDGSRSWSQLKTDKVYFLDHQKKIYAVEPMGADNNAVESRYFTTLLTGFFKGKEYSHFDDLGPDGNLKKYKVRPDDGSQDEIFLYVDPATGIVAKQELLAHNEKEGNTSAMKYTYEIKDLKLDVDADAFQIPPDYKYVDWDQYSPNVPAANNERR